jgi:uncharacterized membrane protein
MYFFTLLFSITGLSMLASRLGSRRSPDRRACRRLGMTGGFLFTGIDHLLNPDRYRPMLPSYVPYPDHIVWVSGMCELTGSVGLMIPRRRRAAGLLLMLYLVCETPANVKMAVDGLSAKGMPASPWFYRGRLLLIPLAIWWAWDCGVRASHARPYAKRQGSRVQSAGAGTLA